MDTKGKSEGFTGSLLDGLNLLRRKKPIDQLSLLSRAREQK
jgi:hypothetical protein